MNPAHERKWITLLFNPFYYLAGGPALALGLAAIMGAGLLGALSHTHFDGVLDTHTGAPAPFAVFLAEGPIDWFCLALTLLIFGKMVAGTDFRAIDLIGTQALARWPALIIALLALPPATQRFSRELLRQFTHPGGRIEWNVGDGIIFVAATLAMIPFLAWMVALMYRSYSFSCNIKGAKAVTTFIAGLLLAEILSKLAVYALFKFA